MKHSRLVIIGGGVTGLAAAWEAQTHIGDAYTLIESEPRLGGKVITARREAPGGQGTFVIDGGPESFVTRKPELTELAEEAGIPAGVLSVVTTNHSSEVGLELCENPLGMLA